MTQYYRPEYPPIIIDTREQRPLKLATDRALFAQRPDQIKEFRYIISSLPVGDYGLVGFSDWNNPRFIIERKSVADLVGSLTSGRERFVRMLLKMRQFSCRSIVIEGTRDEVVSGEYRSQASPASIIESLRSIDVNMQIQIVWAGNAEDAAAEVESRARHFIRGIHKDVRRVCETYRARPKDMTKIAEAGDGYCAAVESEDESGKGD